MLYFSSKKTHNTLIFNKLEKKLFSLLFLILISILINLFSNSYAFSQSQSDTTQDSSPKNEAISLDSTSLTKKIKTKFSIGFRGGITNGRFEIATPKKNDKNSVGMGSVFTIFTNYRLNSHFSIQPELAVGRYRSDNTLYQIALLQGTVDYSISTFDLNLMGVYSYPLTDWISLSAEAGLSAAYLYSSFGKVIAPNLNVGGNYDVNSDNQFEKVNYGAIVGLNPSFIFKNITLQTSIRYRYGLNNINTFDYKLNRYLADTERTIQTRDILFQIGFLIPIYKKAKNEE